MPRGHTWLTRGMPRGRPDPDPARTQLCPAHQPPLTGGLVVVNSGPAAVNGGLPPATVVDRRSPQKLPRGWRLAANDLCTRYCAGGGWTNRRMTRRRRYCSSSTRFCTRVQYKVQMVQKNKYKVQKKSILEADVGQCDWWIKNITAANDEI
nr:hypothetical protein [Tanacetum cinerariifolium]